jgi:hypothetical protein
VIHPAHPPVTLDFYTVYGTKILTFELTGTSGNGIEQAIDVSVPARGMYIVKVPGDHFYGSAKLIIR